MERNNVKYVAAVVLGILLASSAVVSDGQRSGDAPSKSIENCRSALYLPGDPSFLLAMEPGGGSGTGG